jgi:hypothetical protein
MELMAIFYCLTALGAFRTHSVSFTAWSSSKWYIRNSVAPHTEHSLQCKDQLISVQRSNSCLLWESYETWRHTVWAKSRVFSFMLKRSYVWFPLQEICQPAHIALFPYYTLLLLFPCCRHIDNDFGMPCLSVCLCMYVRWMVFILGI